jgi:lysozyme
MIDVSSYQGAIDWHAVKRGGVDHAYVKLTEGATLIDSHGAANVRGARAAGVHVGVYHFAHPSSSPIAEARHFLRAATGVVKAGDLVPALDLEVAEGHDVCYLNDWKAQWLHAVDDAIGVAHGTAFYSYLYFLRSMTLYPDRPVWGAAYGSAFQPPPSWHIWQYSANGRVAGIRGAVDLDRILKDMPVVADAI